MSFVFSISFLNLTIWNGSLFQKNSGLLTFLIDQLSSQKKIETGSLEFNVFLCYTGDSLKQCDANDQNALNTCLFQIVEDLRPFMPTGDQFYNEATHFHWRTLEIGGANVQFLFSIGLESES